MPGTCRRGFSVPPTRQFASSPASTCTSLVYGKCEFYGGLLTALPSIPADANEYICGGRVIPGPIPSITGQLGSVGGGIRLKEVSHFSWIPCGCTGSQFLLLAHPLGLPVHSEASTLAPSLGGKPVPEGSGVLVGECAGHVGTATLWDDDCDCIFCYRSRKNGGRG